jgi:hypothetical protein
MSDRPILRRAGIAFVAGMLAMGGLAPRGTRTLAAPSPGAPGAGHAAPGPDTLTTSVGQAVGRLRDIQRAMSPNPLDEDDVLDRVGRDPAKLSAWVNAQIAYEPYRGFLKGARGALVSGRANSADKALLLADLLVKAGFKAQLVQGDASGAAHAAAPLAAPGPDEPDDKAIAAFSAQSGIPPAHISRMLEAAALGRDEFRERLWNRTISDIQTVAAALDNAKVPAPPMTMAAQPAADHWWVRIPSGDLDPTFEGPAGKATRVIDPGKLPDSECHRVTVRMVISQDKTQREVLSASYRSADLFGRTLMAANVPLDVFPKIRGLPQPTRGAVLDALAGATRFQPEVLVAGGEADAGGQATAGKAFDLTGAAIDAGQGQVSSVQRFGGGLGGMLGGGGGDKPKATRLTAAWLEIGLIAPGQPAPTLIHRDLLTDSAPKSPRQRVFDLLATREILLLPEEISDDYATSLTLNTVSGWAQYLSSHAKKDLGRMDPKAFSGRPQFNASLYAFAIARRAGLRRLCEGQFGATSFAHVRPTAVSYVNRFVDAPGAGQPAAVSRCLDILDNTLVPAGPAPGKPAAGGWRGNFCFACGMLDTALEHEILGGGTARQNASVALEQAELEGSAPVVAAGTIPADARLTATAIAAIRPELARSAFVVLPGAPAAWYRVSLDTGMSLGFIEGGGGQEASEYAEMAEVLNQLIEIFKFYADLGRCLGAAISNPLVGKVDPHENLAECFKAACSMIPFSVGQLSEVEATWTNLIICKSISSMWEKVCDKLWDKVGGEGGGGEGGGGGGE